MLPVSNESVGEAETVGDEREFKSDEFGNDQMLIGEESPMPSSQSMEFSVPTVFHKSINSGRIIIEADLDDVDDPDDDDEHVDEPVDDVNGPPLPVITTSFFINAFKFNCSNTELKPSLYRLDKKGSSAPMSKSSAPFPVRNAMCASICLRAV
jgi:hypothetical protein